MQAEGIQGMRRGRRKRTTVRDTTAARPQELVDQNFKAVSPAVGRGSDVRGDVGLVRARRLRHRCIQSSHRRWALATHLRTDLPLDALEMALWRRSTILDGLVHHSDAGSQYTSIRYTERLADAGIESSVGSLGDSYDNALAESTIGLYKTELIYQRGPWRTVDEVELGDALVDRLVQSSTAARRLR
jgi:putative transposase